MDGVEQSTEENKIADLGAGFGFLVNLSYDLGPSFIFLASIDLKHLLFKWDNWFVAVIKRWLPKPEQLKVQGFAKCLGDPHILLVVIQRGQNLGSRLFGRNYRPSLSMPRPEQANDRAHGVRLPNEVEPARHGAFYSVLDGSIIEMSLGRTGPGSCRGGIIHTVVEDYNLRLSVGFQLLEKLQQFLIADISFDA